ncbi:TPA: hypothetical protein N0F65_006823 [Lagenidium giganteum]|uniref:Uncharacterized protein n=1 Tax=Lagenidium giganteum TaxID=4803 RepID=A0AAV2ZEG1_9STRA|nr:TPA: hypothetical protein N0F65_006823 [Lagenidium giganteum]
MDRRYNLRSSSASRSDRHRSRYSSNNSDGGSANRYADRSSPVRYSESKRVVDDDSRFTTSSSSVQRVLYRSDDDDDDDDDDNDRKERDSAENVYRSRTRRSSSSHSDDKDDDSDNTRSDSDDREDERDRSAGHLKKKRFAAQYRRKATFAEGLRRRLALPERARHVVEFVQRLVNTVLRNSFMLCNVLWLLTPLGCFIIAVVVPTHLTRAMGYADMLANIGTPAAGNTTAGYGQVYESGSLKSIVQEIVDVKLSAVREEVLGLQQIVTAQREELEALRLLHESMRQVNEEHQKKFSLTDSQSALSIHIERTLSKSVDELVRLLHRIFCNGEQFDINGISSGARWTRKRLSLNSAWLRLSAKRATSRNSFVTTRKNLRPSNVSLGMLLLHRVTRATTRPTENYVSNSKSGSFSLNKTCRSKCMQSRTESRVRFCPRNNCCLRVSIA